MKNKFLRHLLATISYRFERSIEIKGKDFGTFSLGKGSRSPVELIQHMYDVLNFSGRIMGFDEFEKCTHEGSNIDFEIDRFRNSIKSIDDILKNNEIDVEITNRIIQGPFSDILTHIGQMAMLNRLNDNPIKGENYSRAKV